VELVVVPSHLLSEIRAGGASRRVFVATFFLTGMIFAAHAEEYTIPSWPNGINQLPCSAFRKNPDGSWTVVATVHAGDIAMSNVTFRGGGEVKIIEAKCGSA
jgi:hypothetical protein